MTSRTIGFTCMLLLLSIGAGCNDDRRYIEGGEGGVESGIVQVKILHVPFDAHEEEPQVVILMLIGVQYIRSVGVKKAGDSGDESFLIRAVDEENGRIRHIDFAS